MPQLADTIGMFVRTLPLVSRMTGGTVVEALKSIHAQIVETLSRERYPYAVLAEKYGVKPNVMYVYQGDLTEEHDFGAAFAECHRLPLSAAMSPLSVEIVPEKDRYAIRLEYESGLYGADEIRTLAKAFANMARGMSESKTETQLRDVEIVDARERDELIQLGTGEKLDYDRSKTFVDLFREQVERTPDAVAVVDCDSSIAYRELDGRSDALARWLVNEKGVKPDDFVAVMLPRRKEFVVAVLGIWKAGAAYVPIDPAYPEERKRFMIEDCEAKVILDDNELSNIHNSSFIVHNLAKPSGLAYMIYTSGSTGKPKGVMIPHSNLTNFVHAIAMLLKLTAADRIACSGSFSFDAHIEDVFPILTVGGSSHVMPEEVCLDLGMIREFLFNHRITGGGYTTQLGRMLLQTYDDLPVRFVTVGGEALSSMSSSRIPIINMYGPTECTVDATYHVLEPGPHPGNVPIGRPMPNTFAFILDGQGKLLPRGAVGELCIAGRQLAKGYWNRPELTEEKFVPMYRTGDLCRWNDDGQLEYIGRIDNQVKLRGFRVELGEVESAAQKLEGVRQAVAVVKDDRLVLYYTGEKIANANFAAHYSELPDYMMPSVFVRLEAMPLTPSGKIDRKRLPEPEVSAEEIVAPRTLMEKELTDLIRESARLKSFGVTTNLISVGLTSLSAMRIAVKASRKYGVSVRMADFMLHPTVEGLAGLPGKALAV